jgi:hypothetical protein
MRPSFTRANTVNGSVADVMLFGQLLLRHAAGGIFGSNA